jgi:hypothetical protein
MSYEQDPDERYEMDRPSFKHSGFGIASFIIGVAVGFLAFLLFAIAGALDATTPGGLDEESAAFMFLGLGLFALMFVDLIGLGLGIAGICQARRNKTFGVLGIVIAILTFIGFGLLLLFAALSD